MFSSCQTFKYLLFGAAVKQNPYTIATQVLLSHGFYSKGTYKRDIVDDDNEEEDDEIAHMEKRKLQKKKAFHAIMKKKYLPKNQEKEVNLLTWAAKEQIKHLHSENPEEWTVGHIAESFPISEDGVRLLLKSAYVPKSLNEVIKHDRRVINNWQNIKSHEESGPLTSVSILSKISNANGIHDLPIPKIKLLSMNDLKLKKPGIFENIVKDYCEKNKFEEKNNTPELNSKKLNILNTKNIEVLNKISNTFSSKQKLLVDGKKASSEDDKFGKQFATVFSKKDLNLNHHKLNDNMANFYINNHTMENKESDEYKNDDENQNLDRFNTNTRTLIFSNNEDVSKENSDTLSSSSINFHQKYENKLNDSNEIHPVEEVFYDENLGYQYPYGRKEKLKSRIKLNRFNTENYIAQKGKDFYDENGEFLYRIP